LSGDKLRLQSQIQPGLYRDLPGARYYQYSDGTRPLISPSVAKLIVGQSPRHAWWVHPQLGGRKSRHTAAMGRGTLLHQLVLGAGDSVVVLRYDSYRSKAAQQERDSVRATGATPVLEREYDEAKAAAVAVTEELTELGFSFRGSSEVAAYWTEESSHGEVGCCCRMDHLDGDTILDLKFVSSAKPDECFRHMHKFGADIQGAANVAALETLRPELAGRVRMVFLFVELSDDGPLCITPVSWGGTMAEMGQMRWNRATAIWANLLGSGSSQWPAYVTTTVQAEAPPYAFHAEIEAEGIKENDDDEAV
jgi:hypothetical protein